LRLFVIQVRDSGFTHQVSTARLWSGAQRCLPYSTSSAEPELRQSIAVNHRHVWRHIHCKGIPIARSYQRQRHETWRIELTLLPAPLAARSGA